MRPHPAAVAAVCGAVALALLPQVVPPYYVGLMIPFYGYAIALLGSICCSATLACCRSGTRCFSASAPTGGGDVQRVRRHNFELVLVVVMLAAA